MDALPGMDVPVNLFPLKVKSWTTKRLCTVTKNNSQLGGTDTRCCASKQGQFASRTTDTRVRIRSWRISSSSSITFQYETVLTPACTRGAPDAFQML